MVITFPLLTVIDDSGVITAGATVAITSVKDRAGTDIASPGATVNLSGANVSVDYDAAAKGEAWIVLAISKVSSTFTGLNAAPAFFLSADPSKLQSTQAIAIDGSNHAVVVLDPAGTDATTLAAMNAAMVKALVYLTGTVAGSPTASTVTITLDAALNAGAVGLTFTGLYVTFPPPGLLAPLARAPATYTVASTTSIVATFSPALPAAPAVDDPATISA